MHGEFRWISHITDARRSPASQRETGVFTSIAQLVQQQECFDRFGESTACALGYCLTGYFDIFMLNQRVKMATGAF